MHLIGGMLPTKVNSFYAQVFSVYGPCLGSLTSSSRKSLGIHFNNLKGFVSMLFSYHAGKWFTSLESFSVKITYAISSS